MYIRSSVHSWYFTSTFYYHPLMSIRKLTTLPTKLRGIILYTILHLVNLMLTDNQAGVCESYLMNSHIWINNTGEVEH